MFPDDFIDDEQKALMDEVFKKAFEESKGRLGSRFFPPDILTDLDRISLRLKPSIEFPRPKLFPGITIETELGTYTDDNSGQIEGFEAIQERVRKTTAKMKAIKQAEREAIAKVVEDCFFDACFGTTGTAAEPEALIWDDVILARKKLDEARKKLDEARTIYYATGKFLPDGKMAKVDLSSFDDGDILPWPSNTAIWLLMGILATPGFKEDINTLGEKAQRVREKVDWFLLIDPDDLAEIREAVEAKRFIFQDIREMGDAY